MLPMYSTVKPIHPYPLAGNFLIWQVSTPASLRPACWERWLPGKSDHRESRECRERKSLHDCGYGGLNLVNKK